MLLSLARWIVTVPALLLLAAAPSIGSVPPSSPVMSRPTITTSTRTLVVPAPTLRARRPPGRVMVVGDSITVGLGGSDPWRCRMWRAAAHPYNMVGPFSDLSGPGGYPAPCDPDHNAIWGRFLSEAAGVIGQDVRTHKPEVVVVLLGVNDVNHAHPLSQITGDWLRLISGVRGARSSTRIVIGTIMPTNGVVSQSGIDAVNGWLIANAPAQRVTLVRTDLVIDPVADLYDGVHPGPTGAAKLAAVFGSVIG